MKVRSSCPPVCARPPRSLRCFVRCRGTAHHLRQVRHISWLLSRERSGFPSENDQLTSRKAPNVIGVSPPLLARVGLCVFRSWRKTRRPTGGRTKAVVAFFSVVLVVVVRFARGGAGVLNVRFFRFFRRAAPRSPEPAPAHSEFATVAEGNRPSSKETRPRSTTSANFVPHHLLGQR